MADSSIRSLAFLSIKYLTGIFSVPLGLGSFDTESDVCVGNPEFCFRQFSDNQLLKQEIVCGFGYSEI